MNGTVVDIDSKLHRYLKDPMDTHTIHFESGQSAAPFRNYGQKIDFETHEMASNWFFFAAQSEIAHGTPVSCELFLLKRTETVCFTNVSKVCKTYLSLPVLYGTWGAFAGLEKNTICGKSAMCHIVQPFQCWSRWDHHFSNIFIFSAKCGKFFQKIGKMRVVEKLEKIRNFRIFLKWFKSIENDQKWLETCEIDVFYSHIVFFIQFCPKIPNIQSLRLWFLATKLVVIY